MAKLAEPTQMVFEDLTPASTQAEVLVEEWLRPQKRFAHLFAKEAGPVLAEIQLQVDDDRAELKARCKP